MLTNKLAVWCVFLVTLLAGLTGLVGELTDLGLPTAAKVVRAVLACGGIVVLALSKALPALSTPKGSP